MLIPKHIRSEVTEAYAEERDRLAEGVLRARISGLSKEILDSLFVGEPLVSDNIDRDCKIRHPNICEKIVMQDLQGAKRPGSDLSTEREYTVWHAIRTSIPGVDDVLIMLTVSQDRRYWQAERDDLAMRMAEVVVASMPYGDMDGAKVSLRLTSGGLYVPYLQMDTGKLFKREQKKALG